ncbi:MAG: glutathione S-transferase family protein [Pseudomonadota bacterium]
MQLYSIDHSPYATRVRIQLVHKGIEADVRLPPVPLRTPEFRAAFPLGKVPILVLDDGEEIAESTAIMDFLEAMHPEQPLHPAGPLALAHNTMLERCADNHLGPALFQLFGEVFKPSGDEVRAAKFDALSQELDKLQNLLAALPPYGERGLQTGDLCLVTNLRFVEDVSALLNRPGLVDDYPGIIAWRDWARTYPAVAEGVDHMAGAFEAFLQQMREAAKTGAG